MARAARRAGRSRRRTDWSVVLWGTDALVTTPDAAFQVGSGTFVDEPGTLVRTRGSVLLHLVPSLEGDSVEVGLGIGIFPAATTDDVTPPAQNNALPGPLSEAGYGGGLWAPTLLL